MSLPPRPPSSVNSQNHSFHGANPSTSNANANASQANMEREMATVKQLILELRNRDLRENAILALSKKREIFHNLGPLLWDSFGTIAILLQEIISVYPVLSPPTLTLGASNRVCNALTLLQCVASHQETRASFLSAIIPIYLYPFLNTRCATRPFQYLRLSSLGVIDALVKVDDTEAVGFLLSTEIIPLCFPIMEMDTELSKTVATSIVQKILLNDMGLDFICKKVERFFDLGRVLANMVESLTKQPSPRLLKQIILCYLRLSENPRACIALRIYLPGTLTDSTFNNCLREDQFTYLAWQRLVRKVFGAGGQG